MPMTARSVRVRARNMATGGTRSAKMVDKVKKAERVKASHLLGIDSPIVIWRTDLDTLGLGGDHPGGVEPGGGGTSEPPPAPQTIQYLATCDAVNHEPA